jgi:putative ABC transport system permease protein
MQQITDVMHDFRHAVRALRAAPVVTGAAVLSLALGIGANTAIFSIVNSLVLRALPVVAPDQLALVTSVATVSRGQHREWNYPVWDEIRRRPELFDGAVAWSPNRFNLAPGGPAELVDGVWVNGSFFSALGVRAAVGRTFSDADDVQGGGLNGAVAVLSDEFAKRRFGRARAAIGRSIALDKVPFTIVGVTPPGFFGLDTGRTFDVAVPFGDEPLLRGRESRLLQRGDSWLSIVVRRKPNQTIQAATAALQNVQRAIWEATIGRTMRPEYREQYFSESFALVPAATGQSLLRDRYQRPLLALMIVVVLVLIIACANIANLLMARASARQHELSVRLALGASRWRLARQLLAESALVAAAGAAGGLVIAGWGSRLLVRQLSTRADTVSLDLSLDWRVLAFTIAAAAATALLFGTAPAWTASRNQPASALRTSSQQLPHGVASNWIVVAQVALSLLLVVAAGLFIRTFSALATRQLGFDKEHVLIVGVDSRRTSIVPAQRADIFARVRERVRALPGITDAAISMITPVDPLGALVLRADVSGGTPVPPTLGRPNAFTNVISPGWFRTFSVPLIAGRDFRDDDGPDEPRVAIVNETLARQFLEDESAIGHTITLTAPARKVSMEIVGVVADAVYMTLRETVPATVYTPMRQLYMSPSIIDAVSVSVRGAGGSPAALTRSVAAAISEVNPELALTFQPLADQVNASLTQERIVAELSGFFGGLALLLAALGLYGVTAASVARRRAEIGIRMALGAAPAAVVRLVLSRVVWLVAAGVLAGTILSLWASRFVAAMLYDLQPRDPLVLVASVVLLVTIGAVAGWLPARRASRIDPAQVLRES